MTRKLTLTTILAMAALVLAVPAFGSPDTDELISVGLSGPQYTPDAFERAVAANQLRQTSVPRYSDSATTAMVVDKQASSLTRYSDSATASIEHAVLALRDRRACLLSHHGLVAYGKGLPGALALAIEVETLARQYLYARMLGPPPLLPEDEMARVLAKFEEYGKRG